MADLTVSYSAETLRRAWVACAAAFPPSTAAWVVLDVPGTLLTNPTFPSIKPDVWPASQHAEGVDADGHNDNQRLRIAERSDGEQPLRYRLVTGSGSLAIGLNPGVLGILDTNAGGTTLDIESMLGRGCIARPDEQSWRVILPADPEYITLPTTSDYPAYPAIQRPGRLKRVDLGASSAALPSRTITEVDMILTCSHDGMNLVGAKFASSDPMNEGDLSPGLPWYGSIDGGTTWDVLPPLDGTDPHFVDLAANAT